MGKNGPIAVQQKDDSAIKYARATDDRLPSTLKQ